jgi:hypothetical protein
LDNLNGTGSESVSSLEYAAPRIGRARASLYPAIIFLGAAPLVVGVSILILYWITRWDWLMGAGFYTLGGGAICFFGGVICLLIFWFQESRSKQRPPGEVRKKVGLAALLLASNWPVAFVCVAVGVAAMTRVTVTVINEGDAPIESFVVTAPGFSQELGPVAPGKKAKCVVRATNEGALEFAAKSGGVTTTASGAYVGDFSGGDYEVTVSGGKIVSRKRR